MLSALLSAAPAPAPAAGQQEALLQSSTTSASSTAVAPSLRRLSFFGAELPTSVAALISSRLAAAPFPPLRSAAGAAARQEPPAPQAPAELRLILSRVRLRTEALRALAGTRASAVELRHVVLLGDTPPSPPRSRDRQQQQQQRAAVAIPASSAGGGSGCGISGSLSGKLAAAGGRRRPRHGCWAPPGALRLLSADEPEVDSALAEFIARSSPTLRSLRCLLRTEPAEPAPPPPEAAATTAADAASTSSGATYLRRPGETRLRFMSVPVLAVQRAQEARVERARLAAEARKAEAEQAAAAGGGGTADGSAPAPRCCVGNLFVGTRRAWEEPGGDAAASTPRSSGLLALSVCAAGTMGVDFGESDLCREDCGGVGCRLCLPTTAAAAAAGADDDEDGDGASSAWSSSDDDGAWDGLVIGGAGAGGGGGADEGDAVEDDSAVPAAAEGPPPAPDAAGAAATGPTAPAFFRRGAAGAAGGGGGSPSWPAGQASWAQFGAGATTSAAPAEKS